MHIVSASPRESCQWREAASAQRGKRKPASGSSARNLPVMNTRLMAVPKAERPSAFDGPERGVLLARYISSSTNISKRGRPGFKVAVHEAIPKWRPIVVVGSRVQEDRDGESAEGGDSEKAKQPGKDIGNASGSSIILSCYLPGFFPESDSASKNGDIMVEGNHLTVVNDREEVLVYTGGHYHSDEDEGEERKILEFVLTRERAGQMVHMTGSMLRQHWGHTCPECGGGRSICPGCGRVSERYDMPCPSCVGGEWPDAYMNAIRYEADEESAAEVWRELDEMDSAWLKPSLSFMFKISAIVKTQMIAASEARVNSSSFSLKEPILAENVWVGLDNAPDSVKAAYLEFAKQELSTACFRYMLPRRTAFELGAYEVQDA
ncbi:hypothetical protein B0H15DRAFT_799073 [Mycena belliarum]|uniref:Uncharacterized protein n=1 Tax=Mycena belliarum TaxID=1033014 RepID=A0AAD6UD78_9AGAR|nr:hypothetical protein B0H15DRAFT_799073 [Mycena belliae]